MEGLGSNGHHPHTIHVHSSPLNLHIHYCHQPFPAYLGNQNELMNGSDPLFQVAVLQNAISYPVPYLREGQDTERSLLRDKKVQHTHLVKSERQFLNGGFRLFKRRNGKRRL